MKSSGRRQPGLPLLLLATCSAMVACSAGSERFDAVDELGGSDLPGDEAANPRDVVAAELPTDSGDLGADGTTAADTDDGAQFRSCQPCPDDGECGSGFLCVELAESGERCLRACDGNADCPSGFRCRAHEVPGVGSKLCIPQFGECVDCIFDGTCGETGCCDFRTGECIGCRSDCDFCFFDFQCGAGRRCAFEVPGDVPGRCLAECPDGGCEPEGFFTCQQDALGRPVCWPMAICPEACPADRPWVDPETFDCVACVHPWHCENPLSCDPETHRCVSDACVPPGRICEEGGGCQQCCEHADCADVPGASWCVDGLCRGEPCNGACQGAYPVCVVINGIEQCVACVEDAECTAIDPACTCTGAPLYSCIRQDGAVCSSTGDPCGSPCEVDADCPPGPNQEDLSCYKNGTDYGICHNPDGSCDVITSCCGAGQTCFDVMALLSGETGGGMPGGTDSSPMGYCSCDEQHPCLGGQACTLSVTLCLVPVFNDMVCVNGQLPSSVPEGLCVDLAVLLDGLI